MFISIKESKLLVNHIDLSQNKLNDDCMTVIGEYVQHKQSLKSLVLSMNNITDKGIKEFSETFAKNVSLESLDLSFNPQITNECVPYLLTIVKKSNIDSLNLSSDRINLLRSLALPLLSNLVRNKRENIDISSKHLGDEDIKEICEYLKIQNCKTFNAVTLENNKITEEGASRLLDTLKELDSKVTGIKLDDNYIQNSFMTKLAEYANYNKLLESVSLQYNEITNRGIESLAKNLVGNETLKKLYLQWNGGINDKSIPSLLKIMHTTDVMFLDLHKTGLSDWNEFRTHSRIKEQLKSKNNILKLRSSDVNERVPSSFATFASKYGTAKLEKVVFSGDFNNEKSTKSLEERKFKIHHMNAMIDAIRDCGAKLKRFTLSGGYLDEDCIKSIGKLCKTINTITYVDLSNNNITDKGIETLSESFFANLSLNELNLTHNPKITNKSIPKLIELIKFSSLKVVNLKSTAISQKHKLSDFLAANALKFGTNNASDSININTLAGIIDTNVEMIEVKSEIKDL